MARKLTIPNGTASKNSAVFNFNKMKTYNASLYDYENRQYFITPRHTYGI